MGVEGLVARVSGTGCGVEVLVCKVQEGFRGLQEGLLGLDRKKLYGVYEHALFARGVGAWLSVSGW